MTGRFTAADHQRLTEARAGAWVRVIAVSRVGDGDELAERIRGDGGVVQVVDDRSGYVTAELAAASARRLDGTIGALALALDRRGTVTDAGEPVRLPVGSVSGSKAKAPASFPRVGPVNPYLPTGTIGAPQFVAAHPRYDGRGVRIAIVDSLADWTVPGMRVTTTGQPKVARAYSLQPSQMVMTNRIVPVSSGRFVIDGQNYLAPRRAAVQGVRFGSLLENGVDMDLDGTTNESFGVAVVSSSRGRSRAFVDTDGDHSFADETELSDWNTSHATASFGHDRPETADVVEVRPFGLNLCQTTGLGACAQPSLRRGDAWSLVTGSFATADASVAAGHDLRLGGGHFDGVAPGAQLWMIDTHGPDRAMWGSDWGTSIVLAARDGADVIVAPVTLGRSFFPDTVDVLSPLVDNVIDAYDVPVVTSAGGTIGLGSVDTAPQGSRQALLVGPYMHPDTFAVLNGRKGIGGERFGDAFAVSGPHMTTGRPTPDVMAPSPTLFAWPRFRRQLGAGHAPGLPVGALPPGLSAGFAWGMAAPNAGGVMALLISAARAAHVRYDAHSLKRALELSGRPLHGDHTFTRTEIGNGLIRVEQAWRWLQRLGRAGDHDLRSTVAGDYTSGSGDSIYQRNTVRSTERVTFSTGSRRTRNYRAHADQPWIHIGQTTITVPGATRTGRGTTSLSVHLDPSIRSKPGLYTGSIVLDDPATTDPADLRVPVTIVTPNRFDAADELHFTGRVDAGTNTPLFLAVPDGTKRLTLTLRRPIGEPSGGMWLYYRQRDPDRASDNLFQIVDDTPSGVVTEVIDSPNPGTLELSLYADETFRPADQPIISQHSYDLAITLEPS